MIELLAPAGNLQKLKTAVHFGADAVYFGGPYSLRAAADGFSGEALFAAMKELHARGKKGYLTLNVFAREEDFPGMERLIRTAAEAGVDAVILSDPGVLSLVKSLAPEMEIHLSTQANTCNSAAAAFWAKQGVRRIVVARELSLKEISAIRKKLPREVELECFVHGAMCISYSGRCLLSDYFTGRRANHGECAQPCRWEYELRERSRGWEEGLSVCEDARGTYLLNSRDLNMLAHLSELIDAGADSFKLEGRMKSEYYVGTVVNAYRRALDDALAGRPFQDVWAEELEKAGHRAYTTGFYFGKEPDTQYYPSSRPVQTHSFAALVLEYDPAQGRALVEQRNRFAAGDTLEIVSPGEAHGRTLTVRGMTAEDGSPIEDAKLVQQRLWIDCAERLLPFDMLRRRDGQ